MDMGVNLKHSSSVMLTVRDDACFMHIKWFNRLSEGHVFAFTGGDYVPP